jgi:hypothetical protein
MRLGAAILAFWLAIGSATLQIADVRAQTTDRHPFVGVTHVTRVATTPRDLRMHIVLIDLTAPGIRVTVTPPGGPRETIRQTTLQFLREARAQVAVNAHFFLPFPSANPFASLIGLAASNGSVYSAFEAPEQSYAIVSHAPAINIDANNRATVVHARVGGEPTATVQRVTLWNTVAGSAQIVTNGVKTIPAYRDAQHPAAALTPGGPGEYSNSRSWYEQLNARTAIGLANAQRTLVLFVVDRASGSLGMSVGEVADLLIRDYRVEHAINLDGGWRRFDNAGDGGSTDRGILHRQWCRRRSRWSARRQQPGGVRAATAVAMPDIIPVIGRPRSTAYLVSDMVYWRPRLDSDQQACQISPR